jgi:hypothetical protein
MYVGPAPYEVCCDGCKAAGPAEYHEESAVEKAEEQGWACTHGPDGNDFCPACFAKSELECGSCPACRERDGKRVKP